MFPIRDDIPSRHRPYMVFTIIGLNSLFFLYELGLSQQDMVQLFHVLGVVPARFTDPQWSRWMGYPAGGGISLLTHMFLHSGWLHFLFNMWTLWIFADNVEDVMGPVRFAIFYLLSGVAALAAHVIFNMDSTIPIVGASGAIAGIMGAYLLLFPHAKVVTFIPIFFIPYFVDLPAVLYLAVWFMMQLVSGVSSHVSQTGAGVAWWAHIGGFVAGMAMLPFFKDEKRCQDCYKGGDF
jgi:membrane associated rhomboid family serine protease